MGARYGRTHGHPSFVFLEARSKEALASALAHTRSHDIHACEFHEPYGGWGLTAFATEPVTQDKRHAFAEYKLWRKP